MTAADVVARILDEDPLPVLEAIRSAGIKSSYERALRWVRSGELEFIRIGRRYYTSIAAVRRYIAKNTKRSLQNEKRTRPQPALRGVGKKYLTALRLDRNRPIVPMLRRWITGRSWIDEPALSSGGPGPSVAE